MCADHANSSQDTFRASVFGITDAGQTNGTASIVITGDLDAASCGRLAARLEQLADSGTSVALDISGLTFLDSSGLSVLLRHMRDASRHGWSLQISGGVLHPQVERVIDLTGVRQILWPSQPSDGDGDSQ